MPMSGALIASLVLAAVVLFVLAKTAVVVPQQNAFVVERLGKFHSVLGAGFHILAPFFDVIRYRHSLKETAIDIPEQICITRDNVQVGVDGVLYLKVLDPSRASYGISNYIFAITQLAQTTLRSEVGKIDLDRTFEERTNINTSVVGELDKASEAWGVKVLRYEIKNINPPKDVLAAMEKQMRAEREKRAVILTSEGVRDAAINTAEGEKQKAIKASEGNKQQQINEADGQAAAIRAVADATAEGLRKVAEAINEPGGFEAVQLRVAQQYIPEFGKLAKASNTMILPLAASDIASMVAMATNVIRKVGDNGTSQSGSVATAATKEPQASVRGR
jgi:regulator of protease activity HflC (stomatin/prohibitin superfamily)